MKHLSFCILFATILAGCSQDITMISSGLDEVYYIDRMQKLILRPALDGEEYIWKVNGDIVSTSHDFVFVAKDEGSYDVTFESIDSQNPYTCNFTIYVLHEEVEYSPYITRVLEYQPAPGQFINETPKYEPGDTYTDMLRKAEESISGTNDILISLGGYGGFVTFAFDHTIVNVNGENDFRIWGNAFYEQTIPDAKGGSAEPGIIMVSFDANENGVADDPWYELAGSEYHNPVTLQSYTITYHYPNPTDAPDSDNSLIDKYYCRWTDSLGGEGYIPRNIFHTNQYWPQWVEEKTLTFTGSLLPANGVESGVGNKYFLYSLPWGYADNHPNNEAGLNSFNIDNAVDAFGNHVNLPGVDFIRVYTGVNQTCGWLGETSTEISRAQDLHLPAAR